ncbi:RNA polymerase sigma-70 factor (ECF subfamily) [Novosphingobium sp. SG751A]|uniref:RNA polymerase sigma factor n=1 Tax=Novosphingobium sp. SG751A TaxID=2587000 RepID=UPI001556C5EF|nr:RNA polymerase sigma-70 factor (ECF subfamily) [Novosphingobium sp. SG751A]
MSVVRPIDRWFINEVLPHERALLAMAVRLCGNGEDARDLVQDVFARMLATEGWAAITNTRAFMLRTARNLAIERMRRSKIIDFRQIADAEHMELAEDAPDPHQIAEGREAMSDFQQALSQLPERCRTVFVRRRIEEQSPRQIAADLNLSLSTLEKRLARAIELITRALEPRRRADYDQAEEAGESAMVE